MKRSFTHLSRLARDSSGTALVEMSIILPLAIALMAGVVDFGFALSAQATAAKSVREAARYLASLPASSCASAWATANAKNLAVSGNLTGTPLLISSWNPLGATPTGTITATCTNPTNSAACAVPTDQCIAIVSGTVPYQSIIIDSALPINSTFTLSVGHEEPQVGN